MISRLSIAGAVAGVFAAAPAFAQPADFLVSRLITCAPDRITTCDGAGACRTREATAKDKAMLLVFDFAAKTVQVRTAGGSEPHATIIEDRVEADIRHITLRENDDSPSGRAVKFTLTREGKLLLSRDQDRFRAEATCTAAP